MPIKEPNKKIYTYDYSQLTPTVSDELNIAVCINSDTGPIEVTRVNNQTEFLEKYCTSNQILQSDDDTVITAYKLLQFSPIYVTRALDNSVLGGLAADGSEVFTNTGFSKFYQSTRFEVTPSEFSLPADQFYFVVNKNSTDYVFYSGDTEPSVPGTKILVTLPGSTEQNPIYANRYEDLFIYANDATGTHPSFLAVSTLDDNIVVVPETGATISVTNQPEIVRKSGVIESKIGSNLYTISFIENTSVTPAYDVVINGNSYFYDGGNTNYPHEGNPEVMNMYWGNYTPNTNDAITQSTSIDRYFSYLCNELYKNNSNKPRFNSASTTFSVTSGANAKITELYVFGDSAEAFVSELKVNSSLNEQKITSANGITYFKYIVADGITSIVTSPSIKKYSNLGIVVGVKGNSDDQDTDIDESETNYFGIVDSGEVISNIISALGSGVIDANKIYNYGKLYYNGFVLQLLFDILNYNYYTVGNYSSNTFNGYIKQLASLFYVSNTLKLSCSSTNRILYYNSSSITFSKTGFSDDNVVFDQSGVNISSYLFPSTNKMSEDKTYTNFYFKLTTADPGVEISNSTNNIYYYVGNVQIYDPDGEKIKLSSSELRYDEVLHKLRTAIGNTFKSTNTKNGFSLFNYEVGYTYELSITSVNSDNIGLLIDGSSSSTGDSIDYTDIWDGNRFAVINRYPSKTRLNKFIFTQDDDDSELYNLTLYRRIDNGGDYTDYTVAFYDKDKIDSYGMNVYFTYVNDINSDFYLVEGNTSAKLPKSYSSLTFGNTVPIAEPESDDYVNAIDRYRLFNGVYYSFVFDCGYSNASYANALCNLGADIYAEAVITPPNTRDIKQIKRFRDSIGITSGQPAWEGAMDAPLLIDNTIGDFTFEVSPGADYIQKVLINKGSGKEFAPVFGITNGTMSLVPKYKFDKIEAERESLLNSQINTIVWDSARELSYKNLDLTLQKGNTSLSTRNNVRMINAMAHVCDYQADYWIGMFNTTETRNHVQTLLTEELRARVITNQEYAPADLRVVCNESNNPVEVQEKYELVVDVLVKFYGEIRYVKVYQKVYRLRQDLNAI